MGVNYYDVLKIGRDADKIAIKRAYFSEVKTCTPDKDPEGFKILRAAYETLSNDKKRKDYDKVFEVSSDIQDEILTVYDFMKHNQYKRAIDVLTELLVRKPDSDKARFLLAKAYLQSGKTGKADTICNEVMQRGNPDSEIMLLSAQIAVARGYKKKAEEKFKSMASQKPLESKFWIAYANFILSVKKYCFSDICRQAMALSEDMFVDDYMLYFHAACVNYTGGGLGRLFKDSTNPESDNETLWYLLKFVDIFARDNNVSESMYDCIMGNMPLLLGEKTFVPFLEKVLPVLENSRFKTEDDEENIKELKNIIVCNKLRLNEHLHDIFADMTYYFLGKNTDKDDLHDMECYIIFVGDLEQMRSSIRILKDEYPEYFKLNSRFYLDFLNNKKRMSMQDKYFSIYQRLLNKQKKIAGDDIFSGNSDYSAGDFDETLLESFFEEMETFIREMPKIGRNEPCPCGSGKKYKRCCGM